MKNKTQKIEEEEVFVTYTPYIEKVYPLRDDILITGNLIVSRENDLLNQKESTALKYIQTVLAVGPNVPEEIKVGDEVMIDTSFTTTKAIEKMFVVLKGNVEEPNFIIPFRYIICKVDWKEESNLEKQDG